MELQVEPSIGGDVITNQCLDYIFVRDSQRERLLITDCPVTRYMLLAALSSDPRTFDDLGRAWERYQTEVALSAFPWQSTLEQPPENANWLWLDLNRPAFAWHDHQPDDEEISVSDLPYCGGCEFELGFHLQPSAVHLWMNVPPWWHYLQTHTWAELMSQDYPVQESLDYRNILYGEALRSAIAGAVCAISHEHLIESAEDHDQLQTQVRDIHIQWLMTVREDLNSVSPRACLHAHRDWKERELAYRRTQWSHERRPPPSVPEDSHQYRFGPMAIEEILCYFEYCRYSIAVAIRIAAECPQICRRALMDSLEHLQAEWFALPQECFGDFSARELMHAERSLLPRLVTGKVIDDDCPLCRLQAFDFELFGPTFYISDGHWLELEDEFAFSLTAEQHEWEAERETCPAEQQAGRSLERPSHETIFVASLPEFAAEPSAAEAFESDNMSRNQKVQQTCTQLSSTAEEDDVFIEDEPWPKLWHSSFVDETYDEPRLSLLSIGARLSEFMEHLRSLDGEELEIEELNVAFDKLIEAVKAWLVAEVTGLKQSTQMQTSVAVEGMIAVLERMATRYQELTSQSADLQSLVHHWQRLLVPGEHAN